MKIKNVNIIDYKVFKDFKIDFLNNKKEPLDLIVIAGINGTGKTTLLEYFFNNWTHANITIKDKDIFIKSKSGETNLYDSDIDFLNEISSLNEIINLEKADKLQKKLLYLPAKEKKDIVLGKQWSKHTQKPLNDEILNFISYLIFEKELSAKEAYKILREEINNIFEGLDIQVNFKNIDKNKRIFFENSLGDKIPIENLSTGEKELLEKIFYLHISDTKDSVILIDEPEISLHPSWQNRIIKIYKNFARKNNNQIIIATHSPQIIASTPNESLRILVKENNTINAISPNAYGMSINKALTDIMGVNELRDIEVQSQFNKVKNLIYTNNYDNTDFEKEFLKLEQMMQNDNIDFGLLKLELLKRKNDATNK